MRDAAENANGVRHVRRIAHPRQKIRLGGVFRVSVVNDEVFSGIFPVRDVHDFGLEAVQPNPFIAFPAEDERFPVLKENGVFSLRIFFRVGKKGFVVEHVAVLVDFDEGGAFVLKCVLDHRA